MKAVAKRAPRKTANVPAKVNGEVAVKAARGVAAIAAVDPQALLAQAIDRNLPIESMERLLAMRKEMKAEWARDEFFAALAAFQHDCPVVEKNHKVPNKDGKTIRYNYAAIEDLTIAAGPFLEKHGFSWTVKPRQTATDVTAAVHAHHKAGHEEVTEFSVPLDPQSYMSDPQRAAAALTFATRYAFKGAFGIQTKGEDNDAREEDEPPRRRTPIQEPRAHGDAIPVQHEEAPAQPAKMSDHDRCLWSLKATATDPKTKAVVKLFNDNEVIDYTAQANDAKSKPEQIAVVLKDIVDTAKKRTRAVKGDAQ